MPESDFFISYTSEDRPWAEWIAWQLEQDGHRVLVQAWDMVPGSNWVDRMQTGVGGARRTIAVLSRAYLSSVYGQAEWMAAWRDDPLGEQRKLLVLRVEDCERPRLLGTVVSVDLFDLSEAATRRRLHEAVRGSANHRMKPLWEPDFPGSSRAVVVRPQFPGALPEVWNVPARNPRFTGREAELSALDGALRLSGTTTLLGMGGVGKSQLAVEYAHRHSADFDIAWWVPAERPALIAHHLTALGRRLGAPDHPLAELRARGRWLLVFDGADHPGALRDHLPTGSGRVVITTRRNGFRALGEVVEVDVLGRADSTALLRRRLPGITDDDADRLAGALGDLPLAIEQTSAYMDVNGVPAQVYLELLREDAAGVLGQGEVPHHQETLATLWNLSLRTLAAEHPVALRLLGVLAHFGPEPVPLDLFTRHLGVLPPDLARAVARPVEFTGAVGALVDHFLVRRTADEVKVVHGLLPRSVRAAVGEGLDTALALLVADLPARLTGAPENWPRWQALLPHVLAACEQDAPDLCLAWLLDRAATFLSLHGQPDLAEALFTRALTAVEEIRGPDHPDTAHCLNNLAGLLRELGRPAEALPLLERAARIDLWHDVDDRARAANLDATGLVLLDLGRPQEARTKFTRSLGLMVALHGEHHPDVAGCYENLSSAYHALGQDDEAVPLAEWALEITENTYGTQHPRAARCRRWLDALRRDEPHT